MIAADSSVIIDHINGVRNKAADCLEEALIDRNLWVSPVVITELHGIKSLRNEAWMEFVRHVPLLEINDDYWRRAGETRLTLLQKKFKAKLGDTLIAQSCIDHGMPLLTRDQDFRPFAEHCGLRLALAFSMH